MKRIVLIFFFLFSSALCFGQNLKDDAEWTSLIDYVNASYVKSFCEQRCQEDLSEKDVKNYQNGIAPSLEGFSIGNKTPSRDVLKSLLINNGFKGAYNKVANHLESKYGLPVDERTLNNALDITSIDEKTQAYLVRTKESLDKELQVRYNPPVVQKDDNTPEEYKAKKEKRVKKEKRERELNESPNYGWVAVLAVFELFLIVYLFFKLKKLTSWDRIRKKILKSESIAEKFTQNQEFDRQLGILKSKISSLETDLGTLKSATQKLSTKPSPDAGYRQTKNDTPPTPPKPVYPPVFVKNFGEGLLRVVDKSEAQFQLDLLSESSAKFSFCGDVSKALANSDGTFDFVCEQSGSVVDAKSITTLEHGTALRQEDGKWKVVQKAKIKFE